MAAKKMKYSTYKSYYSQLQAHDYDSKSKSIMVELPTNYKSHKMPKEWKEGVWGGLKTPGGCTVYTWGTGFAMHHRVERFIQNSVDWNTKEEYVIDGSMMNTTGKMYAVDVEPGIDRHERLMSAVKELEAIQ